MGGAYAVGGDEKEVLFQKLIEAAHNRFPFLSPLELEFQWSGYLALTNDHLPKIIHAGPQCLAPIGCNGRGIAMTTAIGKVIAERLFKGSQYDTPVPVGESVPFKLHAFRNIGIVANVSLGSMLDKFKI